MNFPANSRKATDAAARILAQNGADTDYLRLAKLAYLVDRASLLQRGCPVFGGEYFSMRKGPTIGDLMNFVNRRNAPGWKATISARKGNALNLIGNPTFETLTERELNLIDAIVSEHFHRSTDDLVNWCHEKCPEYEHVFMGRKRIDVETILAKEGRSKQQIEKLAKRAEELAELDALLA